METFSLWFFEVEESNTFDDHSVSPGEDHSGLGFIGVVGIHAKVIADGVSSNQGIFHLHWECRRTQVCLLEDYA